MLTPFLLAVLIADGPVPSTRERAAVRFVVSDHGAKTGEVVAALRVVHSGADLEAAEPTRRRRLRGGGPVMLELPTGTWALDVEGPNLWHQRQFFVVRSSNDPVVAVDVWPRATVTGSVVHLSRTGTAEIIVRFEGARSELASKERGEVRCPIDEKRFRCSMPAGTFNLRVRPRRFIAHYFADVVLQPGGVQDLGKLRFLEGQSITGRIELPAGIGNMAAVTVTAVAATPEAGRRPVIVTAKPEKSGFFHLDGLAPGAYVVRATVGHALDSSSIHVVVREGSEAELVQPLRLEKPRKLTLDVLPAVHPGGGAWHVRLRRHVDERHLDTVTESSATADGVWLSPPLPPGRYRLSIGTDGGDQWHEEDLTLEAADQHAIVPMSLRKVRGLVTLGDQALRATLTFIAPAGLRVTARSDKDGQFEVVLPSPREPEVSVQIEAKVPEVQRRVAVRLPSDEEEALDIALPDSILMGEVVDSAGGPVDDAIVYISRGDPRDGLTQPRTDARGNFTVHGLPSGVYSIMAAAFLAESTPVTVALQENEAPPVLRLVLRDVRTVRGRVVSRSGPVAGARVHARAVDAPHLVVATRTTDPNGEFVVAVPTDARSLEVAVAPPGFSFVILGAPVSDHPLVVNVDPLGGELVVDAREGELPFLVHNGGTTPVSTVSREWAAQTRRLADSTTRWVLPMMDPGVYSVCRVDAKSAELFRRSAGQTGGWCISGLLAPFGSLLLDVRSE